MTLTRREFTKIMAMAGAVGAAGTFSKASSAPIVGMPANACDCHVHIVGPTDRYPMDPNRVYTAGEASVAELKALRAKLGIARNVLVQPSFYGADNSCLTGALKELGDSARGIAVLAPEAGDDELHRLDAAGVRGIRLNLESSLTRDPAVASAQLETFANRLQRLGWHIQVYAALPVVASLASEIGSLPVPVVIDHFGSPIAADGVGQPGFGSILELVRCKKAFVKLSGCYRISKAPDYADVAPFARALIEAAPEQLVWASDWPHTGRAKSGSRTEIVPFQPVDDEKVLGLLAGWCPDMGVRELILAGTPARLYGFPV